MELVSMATRNGTFSDFPQSTNRAIAVAARAVWDLAPSYEYENLVKCFLLRLVRARRMPDEWRSHALLTLEVARWNEGSDRAAKVLNDMLGRYIEGELDARTFSTACKQASDGVADPEVLSTCTVPIVAGLTLATHERTAPDAAAESARVGWTLIPRTTHAASVEALGALLDHYESMLVATPEGVHVPAAWEDEALEFIDRLCRTSY